MDENLLWAIEKRVERVIKALEKNNMEGYYVKDENEALEKIKEFLKKGSTITAGGSRSLFEIGAIGLLKNGEYNFLDRDKEGITKEECGRIYREAFFADTYLCSTNAITETGELYNIDGNGNRVAAMIFGPKEVIVVTGINKIVKNTEEAEIRLRTIASPANAKRLNLDTPCAKVGYCMDCNSDNRICAAYVTLKKQREKGRIKVIIVNKNLGY
ncbi:membrane protein [Clostridium tetani]|uniref:Lactate utilization protein n=1 Tax=Clostridium tetani TaxID=1513 RepID=A0A4Q0VEJ1_CLOTA|nr:lactate utilization protein [Clostridium tetani]AVP55064.1 lactate utilization protein [Clostridium tetani]KGI44700.1 membrane protein [Clostridium tetani]RXI47200.1 lactate utilization protein [Clostridium tetani]RXI50133.1 lactate utilization protein [Clostridium tetani]RXI53281.1 lactate utilization protein [Clostridium tetani]